jgi:hypothetical protein
MAPEKMDSWTNWSTGLDDKSKVIRDNTYYSWVKMFE